MKHKVLFLASWYPSKIFPLIGIFVKRHAEAVSTFCDVAVLQVVPDTNLKEKNYEIELKKEKDVLSVIVYYKDKQGKKSFLSKIITIIHQFKAERLGFKIIKEKFGKPNIVHVNVIMPMGLFALFLNYFKGIPFIVTEHWTGYMPNVGKYKGRFTKFITSLVIKKAKAVTTVSNSLSKAMINCGLKNNYNVIPNVVDFDLFSVSNKWNRDKKKILHVSTLYNVQKNVEGIIRAVNNISQLRNDFEIHFAGDGQDRQYLENLTKKLQLENYIIFHGKVSDTALSKLFFESDFFVINSNYETFSVVTAEALASGLPVIATKCGGPEEFVTKDVGILIEPKNKEQLKKALIYMLDNHQKYDKKKLR